MANAGAQPVTTLMSRLAAARGPVLTWYSVAGERVELSGPVLVQWSAKVSHLLLDLGAEPRERILVDLGADWRAPLVWLAAWWDGLSLVGPEQVPVGLVTADYAVVREDRLAATHLAAVAADCLVVVARGALAPRVANLPAGATDFATVRSFPDQAPPPADEADTGPTGGGTGPAGRAGRTLLDPAAGPSELTAVWAGGGSVVWHDGLDPAALTAVAASEGVTS